MKAAENRTDRQFRSRDRRLDRAVEKADQLAARVAQLEALQAEWTIFLKPFVKPAKPDSEIVAGVDGKE